MGDAGHIKCILSGRLHAAIDEQLKHGSRVRMASRSPRGRSPCEPDAGSPAARPSITFMSGPPGTPRTIVTYAGQWPLHPGDEVDIGLRDPA